MAILIAGDSAVGGIRAEGAGSWAAGAGTACAAEVAAPRSARWASSAGTRRAAARPRQQQALQVSLLPLALLCLSFPCSE